MSDTPVDLDDHRGMAAQKSTELRRQLHEVKADEAALRQHRDELEAALLAAPAADWPEVAEKAEFLIRLFAATPTAQDPRHLRLIASTLDDLARLSGAADGPP